MDLHNMLTNQDKAVFSSISLFFLREEGCFRRGSLVISSERCTVSVHS